MKRLFLFLYLLITISCTNLFHYNNEKEEMKNCEESLEKRINILEKRIDSLEKKSLYIK